MAFVTEKKENKFGAAVTGAMEGVAQGVDMVTKLRNAETQRQFAQAQVEELQMKKQDAMEKRELAGKFALNTLIGQAVDSDDPKAFITNRQGDFEKARAASKSSMTYDSIVELAGVKNEQVKLASKEMSAAKSRIISMTPQTSSLEDMKKAYDDFNAAADKVVTAPELSDTTRSAILANKEEVLKSREKLQDQFYRYGVEMAKITAQKDKPRPESAETRKIGMVLGEDYAKAVNNVPNVQNSVKNLDLALGLLDKVGTGPIKGKRAVYFAQKLGNDDAQRLENYLAKENVIAVMKFAKEAGVRSVDTELEQQRLLDTIANKNQSTPVIHDTIKTMQNLQKEALMLTKEKQAWRESGNSLESFHPSAEYEKRYGLQKTAATKSPHGDVVEQDGVTYVWNGSEYVEE